MNTCGDCALYKNRKCLRTNLPQAPEDYCSSFLLELPLCEICGNPYIGPATYIIEEKKIVRVCGNCGSSLSTCRTCKNASYCDFKENPISLPQTVIQQKRQGNMMMQQTVPNPARIAETCEKKLRLLGSK